jgi:hypothetical protein
MSVTLAQINRFVDNLNTPSFGLNQFQQAESDLERFQTQPHDTAVQKSIDRARILLAIKEEQYLTAVKVNDLYVELTKLDRLISTHPKLTSDEYATAVKYLDYLQKNAESISESDFRPDVPKEFYLIKVDELKQKVSRLDPDAWKIDWIARASIMSAITGFMIYQSGWSNGAYYGLLGGAIVIGIDKAIGLTISGLAHGWRAIARSVNQPQPNPAPASSCNFSKTHGASRHDLLRVNSTGPVPLAE